MAVPGLDPGIVPAIHAVVRKRGRLLASRLNAAKPQRRLATWMAGTSPAMTNPTGQAFRPGAAHFHFNAPRSLTKIGAFFHTPVRLASATTTLGN